MFVEGFDSPGFSVSFNARSLDVTDFMCWLLASAVASAREIVAVQTEGSKCRASEQHRSRNVINEDIVSKSYIQNQCTRLCVHQYLFPYPLKEIFTFCPSSSAFSETWISLPGSWLNLFFQGIARSFNELLMSRKVLCRSGSAVSTSFEVCF